MDQGDSIDFSGSPFATPGPPWTERSDDGLRLGPAEDLQLPADSPRAEPASEVVPGEAATDRGAPEPLASDLIWHLNWLRREAGLFGFQGDRRLVAIAETYCPDLALYFDQTYDPVSGNWAEAMVHNAGGSDLATRSAAAGYPGWSNELLAWTADTVDLSLVARGFWEAPTHKATIMSAEPTLAGAAICRGDDGYFYVVVIGGGAPPLATPEHLPATGPNGDSTGTHNPFMIP